MNILKKGISSQKAILIISLYLAFILNLSFIKNFWENFHIENCSQFFCFILFFILIPLPLILLLNLVLFKYSFKPLSCLIIVISSATNYMMLKMGVLIDVSMIRNVFETNAREAFDLVSWPLVLYIVFLGIIPSFLLCKTEVRYGSFKCEVVRRSLTVAIVSFLFALYIFAFSKEIIPFVRNNTGFRARYNTLNYIVNTARYASKVLKSNKKLSVIDEHAKADMFNPSNTHVIVLIIGETARAQNFSLGKYNRETNPLLSKEKNLVYIDEVSSCGTATAISLPCIFSAKNRSKFDVDAARYEENILDLLQRAGWNVVWYENDDGCKGVCQRIKRHNVVKIGDKDLCFDSYCYDEVLLKHLENTLKNINQNTVIVLHTMGSHGPTYYKRYPDKFKKFTPTCDTSDIQNCTKEEIKNTYDNTILYTDYIISETIEQLKKYKTYETSMLYVSDHGESLGENGLYLHGMPYAIAPKEQKKVPFILWFSDKTLKDSHIDISCLKNSSFDEVSHDNFFHTVLGLSETDSKLYNKNLDILLKCRTKRTEFMKR
ncbi:MAG: phosphoethanolamine--lipid A transferase [Alphaproteobacteria bacterium]|nr:phosphoethanolamine--lipid A transferase [Alphaproteobacteria bacterium]